MVVEAPEGTPAPAKRRVVLVIDDEPAFLRSLQLILEDRYEVVVCSRSPDALALIRAEPRFDAILCDLSMPKIDGVAFYGHLEALGLADRFILMTGGAFTTRGEAFVSLASCRCVSKPFTMETLLEILASAFATRTS